MIQTHSHPILYSFRRCPYAMRARMAVQVANQTCEIREVVLRDKPTEMIEASAKATVPVLVLPNGDVIDESLDIMLWALHVRDPEGWLEPKDAPRDDMIELIELCENEFKPHLDRYKYANRYENSNPKEHRAKAEMFLKRIEVRLQDRPFLFGSKRTLSDIAIAPFVRQFANADRAWFDASPYPALQTWLEAFLASELLKEVMTKFPQWHKGNDPVFFPENARH